MNADEKYMQRAVELAQLGLGAASPNPLVGCVIVHEGRIIGEGYHEKFGYAHAEVNAVERVENKKLLQESTVYVTLEPCAHFGKTPPCADLLVKHQVKRVVIGSRDPFTQVDGRGIAKLQSAGVEVVVGVLEKECRWMNRRFFTAIEQQRPYVILKWAQTADGFIARPDYSSKWISNSLARQLVHKWRSEEDAVLVGKNTALHDNPALTVRDWPGRNPKRLLVDHDLAVEGDYKLFDGQADTLVVNTLKSGSSPDRSWLQFDGSTADLLYQLAQEKIQSVIVEGGAKTLNDFLETNLWDEARIFTAPVTFGNGIAAPQIRGTLQEEHLLAEDRLQIITNHRNG